MSFRPASGENISPVLKDSQKGAEKKMTKHSLQPQEQYLSKWEVFNWYIATDCPGNLIKIHQHNY